ncbi:MAG: A/G-specific adenine glycosylase [Paracoccaceae bacterium]
MRDVDPSEDGPADDSTLGASLLRWYDGHARDLPWRVGPEARRAGQRPDPYRVWLSEIMLQQTTVAAVRSYFERFTTLWPDIAALAAAEDSAVMAEWAGLGYYARARNLLKGARAVADGASGQLPRTEAELRALPGIGAYTAAAVAAIAFDQPATVVDGNVERVMARLFAVETPLPAARPRLRDHAASLTPSRRPGDHAQALMDLGATICRPRQPDCARCPLSAFCAGHREGIAAQLPRKAVKPARPQRQGTVWIARRKADGAWLVERRPETAMLGGMLGWPGTDWDGNASGSDEPPVAAGWQLAGHVRHVFTHFSLELAVMVAETEGEPPRRGGYSAKLDRTMLPTLMRKAFDLAMAHDPASAKAPLA